MTVARRAASSGEVAYHRLARHEARDLDWTRAQLDEAIEDAKGAGLIEIHATATGIYVRAIHIRSAA